MWCDSFDMDLLKVFPQAKDLLAPVANVHLYTHGTMTDGSLNHPAVWNHPSGMVAFFSTTLPVGANKPASYWTDKPVVWCTVEEAFRDCWPHHYRIILNTSVTVWDSCKLARDFMDIMYARRGWSELPVKRVELAERRVIDSIERAVETLKLVLPQFGVQLCSTESGESKPGCPSGSVSPAECLSGDG